MFLWDGNEEEQAILKKYTVCCSSVVVFKAIREGDLQIEGKVGVVVLKDLTKCGMALSDKPILGQREAIEVFFSPVLSRKLTYITV